MTTYADHMDRMNLERRLRVLANREERERMARAAEEQDVGCVTLWMPKQELQARLREASSLRTPRWRPIVWAPRPYQQRAIAWATSAGHFYLPAGWKARRAQP